MVLPASAGAERSLQFLELGLRERLLFQQQLRAALEHCALAAQNLERLFPGVLDDVADREVDLASGFLAVLARRAHRRHAEQVGALLLVGHRAERVDHGEAHRHAARDRGHLGEVVRRAGGEMAEDDVLRGAPAEQHRHFLLQLLARHEEAVLGRALDGVAERADAARDDRDLVHRVGPRQRHGDQRVAHLVMRDDAPLELVQHPVLLLQSGDDALDGAREVVERDLVSRRAAWRAARPR